MDSIKKEKLLSSADISFSNQSGQKVRLDDFLAKHFQSSRSQTLHLIKSGCIFINDNKAQKGGVILREGDVIKVFFKEQIQKRHVQVDFEIDILYEDNDLLILNKPPFLVVHKALSVKEATLVDWLKSKNFVLSNLSGEERAGIVHRLDKETSGAIAIAKNESTHIALSEQLRIKQMGRYYLAIINIPLKESKIVECNLARHPKNRLKITNVDAMNLKISNARYSKSEFIPLLEYKTNSFQLVAIKLYTGRTHQIRAHFETLSRYIIGDRLYGHNNQNIRMMLHAYILHLFHPTNKKDFMFCAPIFGDMLQFCFDIFGEKEFNETIQIQAILDRFNEPFSGCLF